MFYCLSTENSTSSPCAVHWVNSVVSFIVFDVEVRLFMKVSFNYHTHINYVGIENHFQLIFAPLKAICVPLHNFNSFRHILLEVYLDLKVCSSLEIIFYSSSSSSCFSSLVKMFNKIALPSLSLDFLTFFCAIFSTDAKDVPSVTTCEPKELVLGTFPLIVLWWSHFV